MIDVKDQIPIQQYINDILGVYPTFSTWNDAKRIPFTIRSDYDFAELSLLGRKFVAFWLNGKKFSVAKVAKHFTWINQQYNCQGIFIAQRLEAYNRKRLIEKKVPFIIPGNQCYLPDFGFDLREHMRQLRLKLPKLLSPTAQLVLLANLLGQLPDKIWTATTLAKMINSTKMTLSRMTEELESHDLIEVRQEGREKQLRFKENGRALWEKAQPILRSPVQQRVYAENLAPIQGWGSIAGLNALSELTMIARPDRQIRALTKSQWKLCQTNVQLKMIPESSADLANVEFEIWKYDPDLLSNSGIVDPLSLYLSLANSDDERVENALSELLENMQW